MAIDYILTYDCEAKTKLGGVEGFLQTMKYAGRAKWLAEAAQEDPSFDLSKPITHVLYGIDGHEVGEELSSSEIKKRGDHILEFEPLCRDCPANVLGKPGGCCGAINYPITAKAEEWVLDVLPDSLEGNIRGELLKRYIKDFGGNARYVDEVRRFAMLYELRKPCVDTWGKGLFGKTKCTSSVILGNLYCIGPEVEPFHGMMMCYYMGAIDEMADLQPANWVWDMEKLPDDLSVRGLAWLLRTYFQAFLLNTTTFIDR